MSQLESVSVPQLESVSVPGHGLDSPAAPFFNPHREGLFTAGRILPWCAEVFQPSVNGRVLMPSDALRQYTQCQGSDVLMIVFGGLDPGHDVPPFGEHNEAFFIHLCCSYRRIL